MYVEPGKDGRFLKACFFNLVLQTLQHVAQASELQCRVFRLEWPTKLKTKLKKQIQGPHAEI